MQHRRQKHYRDRALYYLLLIIADQGRKGKWDFELTPVYSVNTVDFKLPGKSKKRPVDTNMKYTNSWTKLLRQNLTAILTPYIRRH
jgi:hypothetical protein